MLKHNYQMKKEASRKKVQKKGTRTRLIIRNYLKIKYSPNTSKKHKKVKVRFKTLKVIAYRKMLRCLLKMIIFKRIEWFLFLLCIL